MNRPVTRHKANSPSTLRTLAILHYGLPFDAGCRNGWQRHGRLISLYAAIARGEVTDDHQLTPAGYAKLGMALETKAADVVNQGAAALPEDPCQHLPIGWLGDAIYCELCGKKL